MDDGASVAAASEKGSVAQKDGTCRVKRQVGFGVKDAAGETAVALSAAAKLQMP